MIYQIEDLIVDTGLYRVARGEEQIDVEPQVFDLLVYLIQHRDRVVTRDELLREIWKGRIVSDTALGAGLKAVRRALGDTGRRQNVIKTVHGRGYRFIAAVKERDGTGPPPAAAASPGPDEILPLSEKPSIAVLPFASIGCDQEHEYFSDGLTEDIITHLSRFRDLFVIASNSSFAYKGKAVKIQDVSAELGVRYVLEGSVQRSNESIRISVQLIDGRTGRHLWTGRYDRCLDDLFRVQDEVAETIVGTLASGYGGRLRKVWQRQSPGRPQSALAFDCFMRGLDAVNLFTEEGNREGRELFLRAIETDPNYARAYGKLAWTYLLDAVFGWNPDWEAAIEKGHECALKGREIDDDESWVHWALGAYYFYVRKHEAAIAELERAVELNPNDADVLTDYGLFLSYAGRAEEALTAALRALRLNPHYPDWYALQLVQIHHDARRYREAVAAFERRPSTETPLVRLYLAASHAALGHADEARENVRRALELDPDATLEKWTSAKLAPYKDAGYLEHFRANLRKAGLR